MFVSYFLTPLFSCILAWLFIPLMRKIAFVIQLTDQPNRRKIHHQPVPLVGGIAMFGASWLAAALFMHQWKDLVLIKNIFVASFILLIIGTLDDRFDLRASFRLVVQFLLAHSIFDAGVRIETFYGIWGIEQLSYGQQYWATILVITGIVNAINLMDGIDGLAAGLSLVSAVVLAIIAAQTGHENVFVLLLSYAGSLVAFLRFNFSRTQKIFMGDAGSMTLGLLISVVSIRLLPTGTEGRPFSWILIGIISILVIPVFDALRVFRKRLKAGVSPFHADKTHLHHLVLFLGLRHQTVSLLLSAAALAIMVIGFCINNVAGLTWAIIGMVFVFYVGTSVLGFHHQVIVWRQKIRLMEMQR